MYKIVLSLTISLIFLVGCSENSTSTTVDTTNIPEGVREEYYTQAVETVHLINSKFEDVEELTDKEKQQIETFFNGNTPEGTQETLIYTSLSLLYPAFETNLFSYKNSDKAAQAETSKSYLEEYKIITDLLNMS